MDYYLLLKKQQLKFDVLIPFIGFSKELEKELLRNSINILLKTEKIFLVEPSLFLNKIIWAQDHWQNCKASEPTPELILELKSSPYLGYFYKTAHQATSNSAFIENRLSKLKTIPEKRIHYPVQKKFDFKFYIWTIYKDLVIYSLKPKARYPAGWHEFNENKETPPNRAYLKLWEVFATHNLIINPEHNVIEIGASPGGWSWVLSQIFNKVYTFDRAKLDPKLNNIKNIEHKIADAFKIDPADYKDCDWLFSDLICTPEKIYETVQFWLDHSQIRNFVCTIKFKGECNFEMIDKFLKIPDSKIVRLYHNKNEVTWIRQEKS